MRKIHWPFLAISYTIALTIISLINVNDFPKLGVDYEDKIFHVLAYGLLNLLWFYALRNLKIVRPVLMAMVLSLIYGIILEVLQGQLTITRNLDIIDILANSIGVTIVSLFIVIRNKTIVKKL